MPGRHCVVFLVKEVGVVLGDTVLTVKEEVEDKFLKRVFKNTPEMIRNTRKVRRDFSTALLVRGSRTEPTAKSGSSN